MSDTLKPAEKKFWFPAKKYGYGWGPPNCWQGWAVLAAYVALISGGAFLLRPDKHAFLFIAHVASLSIILTIVCWFKGEKAGWRWGGK